ncbi:uncharacterized protein plekho2 [Genypterus blacodes]|uniref:uncharacterized protein plekho2 n=1 Tax=Genypterus blacodes TaxID=154954 RepID=UPI003F76E521
MDEGVKEEPTHTIAPKFLGKAGWVKKATSRLLASYKERYVHVEKTEVLVYENEELLVCMETLDLEKYERCRELKSAFTKKNRLILIAAKTGSKVHDVKFQAQSGEEKDAWIKALSDGINRAKNKIFDEVKVEDDSGLEHPTRTRPKGNRNRRPPTRIHMKEVAGVSSDGILRLDLDLEDSMMPFGSCDGAAPSVPAPLSSLTEDAEPEEEPQAQPEPKKIKPPMPPTKEKKPTTPEDGDETGDAPEKKVLTPPLPPSKQSKPCTSPAEEAEESEESSHQSPDPKKAGPPPMPPSKPVSSPEDSQPPAPPPKDKKPSKAVEWSKEVSKEEEDEKKEETTGTPVTSEVKEPSALMCDVRDDPAEGSSSEEDGRLNKTSGSETQTSDQLPVGSSGRKNPSTPVPPRKKPAKVPQPKAQPGAQADSCSSETSLTSVPAESEIHVLEVMVSEDVADSPSLSLSPGISLSPSLSLSPGLSLSPSPNLSPLLGHAGVDKKAEEKSVDSGQHSDADSDGSEGEDLLAASTAALRGSHAGLDVLSVSEDEMQTSNSLKVTQPRQSSEAASLKPAVKAKSASVADLLSASSGAAQKTAPRDNVTKLVTEVALEMEKTSELLSRVSKLQGRSSSESVPEELLDKAMEKMTEVDHFLRKLKKCKDSTAVKSSSSRNSW